MFFKFLDFPTVFLMPITTIFIMTFDRSRDISDFLGTLRSFIAAFIRHLVLLPRLAFTTGFDEGIVMSQQNCDKLYLQRQGSTWRCATAMLMWSTVLWVWPLCGAAGKTLVIIFECAEAECARSEQLWMLLRRNFANILLSTLKSSTFSLPSDIMSDLTNQCFFCWDFIHFGYRFFLEMPNWTSIL